MAKIKEVLSICCIIYFLPFLITLVMNRQQAIVLSKELLVEDYLPIMVYLDLPKDFFGSTQENEQNRKEFLKAQIVVTRTNLYFRVKEESKDYMFLNEANYLKNNLHNVYLQKNLNYISDVIKMTEDSILKYQGNIMEAPFHLVSGGYTREGKEAYKDNKYEYLKGVYSSWDVESIEYLKGHFFKPNELYDKLTKRYPDCGITVGDIRRQIQIKEQDSSGYVSTIQIGNKLVSGEELRALLKLNSSNFTIQFYNDGIRFLCKGVGHGLGFSQYGGRVMSNQGKNYKQILKYYFPNMDLSRIYIK